MVTLITFGDGTRGGIALANTPGAVDSTFKTNAGNALSNSAYGVAIQSDGQVLVTGVSDQLKRYSSAGIADTTFNTKASGKPSSTNSSKRSWSQPFNRA